MNLVATLQKQIHGLKGVIVAHERAGHKGTVRSLRERLRGLEEG